MLFRTLLAATNDAVQAVHSLTAHLKAGISSQTMSINDSLGVFMVCISHITASQSHAHAQVSTTYEVGGTSTGITTADGGAGTVIPLLLQEWLHMYETYRCWKNDDSIIRYHMVHHG